MSLLSKTAIDKLLLENPNNLFYLIGVKPVGPAVLAIDKNGSMELFGSPLDLYESFSEEIAIRTGEKGASPFDALTEALIRDKVKYVEIDVGTEGILSRIRNRTSGLVRSGNRFVETFRTTKDEEEIEVMRKSGKITKMAMEAAMESIKEGTTEKEVAREAQLKMIREGADREGFETVVGSGPRSCLPHAYPTEKKIMKGELVVIDLGCSCQNYRTDMTRTVSVGQVGEVQSQILKAVLESQKVALSKVAPGVRIADVALASEEILVKAGFRDNILHGLGHGVGLDIHEEPSLHSKNQQELRENFVVTVEPGLYVRDIAGARWEDTIVVRKQGYESLT